MSKQTITITDNRIADLIVTAHRRGVARRIVTDNDQANDEGSDVERFIQAGIPVRLDRSEFHVALVDETALLKWHVRLDAQRGIEP